jgi:hypothetical protein
MFPGKSQSGSGKGQKKMKTLFFRKAKMKRFLNKPKDRARAYPSKGSPAVWWWWEMEFFFL